MGEIENPAVMLAGAVRASAEKLLELREKLMELEGNELSEFCADLAKSLPDELTVHIELERVLARMIGGKSVYKAFGAPGDWGYGTPVGDSLRFYLERGGR